MPPYRPLGSFLVPLMVHIRQAIALFSPLLSDETCFKRPFSPDLLRQLVSDIHAIILNYCYRVVDYSCICASHVLLTHSVGLTRVALSYPNPTRRLFPDASVTARWLTCAHPHVLVPGIWDISEGQTRIISILNGYVMALWNFSNASIFDPPSRCSTGTHPQIHY